MWRLTLDVKSNSHCQLAGKRRQAEVTDADSQQLDVDCSFATVDQVSLVFSQETKVGLNPRQLLHRVNVLYVLLHVPAVFCVEFLKTVATQTLFVQIAVRVGRWKFGRDVILHHERNERLQIEARSSQ